VLGWFANLVLIPVVTFYLLRDWDRIVQGVHESLPRSWEPTVVRLVRECDEVIGAFIRGQLLVMLALGACYTVGLLLVGLDLALLIGTLAGLASVVPYLGLVLGLGAASIAALVQFGEWLPVAWVVAVFLVAQLAEGMYLTPRLVGDRIGMHPVLVIFAVMAGGQLFGFTGVLLGLPVAAVVLVLLRHVHERYRASSLYGEPETDPFDAELLSGSVGDALAEAAMHDLPGGGGCS
jgi:predicted PurR-regulated permease PerM